MRKVPCKGCPDRKLLCHGFCQRYKQFCAEEEELRKKRIRENDARYGFAKRPGEKFRWDKRK